MTPVETIKEWLQTFPGWAQMENFNVDFTSNMPGSGGIFPAGLTENGRHEDICGGLTVDNQYNFAVYCVLEKPTDDDIQALVNARFVQDLQMWVQQQSAAGLAPTFGEEPDREQMQAQNGTMYGVDADGTAAMYVIQLSAKFVKHY